MASDLKKLSDLAEPKLGVRSRRACNAPSAQSLLWPLRSHSQLQLSPSAQVAMSCRNCRNRMHATGVGP
jgi:hypothetical protein